LPFRLTSLGARVGNLPGPFATRDDRLTMNERRHRRSDNRVEALSLLLASHRSQLRLRALVVTTRDGRMLSGVGPSPEKVGRSALSLEPPRDVATWSLNAGGLEVILAAHGGKLSHELGMGVKRILSS
jgi:hypothetical protein